ncbi:MAG TPA: MBOAT family protein [Xanthobacteraceae bacterium]|nr:MBOAT family protein [Xanthobacteraceae bacterium]
MLFNSAPFIFIFLPVVLAGFFLFGWLRLYQVAVLWTLLASLVFYGWSDPIRLVPIVASSAVFNFCVGRALLRYHSKWLLTAGVAGNLTLLGYFKYAVFVAESFATFIGSAAPKLNIALPIGISFYTLTQIAFLVDTYRKQAREYAPLKYGLFVTYFPHLIAGPILHHREIMPQFDDPETYRPRLASFANGSAWFTAGLFKKVMLADSVAVYADVPFRLAAAHSPINSADAWIGALSYSLQIYFDFSGYSDMAIGLALMMGIIFPLNFNSPYKADSLIEFWRRWHMTLSRFLRDDLYIPLGGNRKGRVRRHVNILITMLLGGIWHGAGLNYALWGVLHGSGLVLNHLWRDISAAVGFDLPRPLAKGATLLVVVFAWVPFRADTTRAAIAVWKSMIGLGRLAGPHIANAYEATGWIAILAAIALFAPNTQEILGLERRKPSAIAWGWRASTAWAVVLGFLFGIAVAGTLTKPMAFLYFRF